MHASVTLFPSDFLPVCPENEEYLVPGGETQTLTDMRYRLFNERMIECEAQTFDRNLSLSPPLELCLMPGSAFCMQAAAADASSSRIQNAAARKPLKNVCQPHYSRNRSNARSVKSQIRELKIVSFLSS